MNSVKTVIPPGESKINMHGFLFLMDSQQSGITEE